MCRAVSAALLFFAASLALAAPPASAPAASGSPQRVTVGIYLLDVRDFDPHHCSYNVDFYVWFRWTGPIDPSRFELLNGHLTSRDHADYRHVDGVNYVSYRCRGEVHNPFDFSRYPLDEHNLTLGIEDADHDASQLVYEPDLAQTAHDATLTLPGWRVGKLRSGVLTITYPTDFGNPARPIGQKATYSRYVVTVPISHRGTEAYAKTFLPLFISVAIAFLTFLIHPANQDSRFVLGVAAIFGAISSQIIVSAALPETAYMTLADRIHFIALAFIFFALLESCVSLMLHRREKHRALALIDAVSLVVFPAAFIVIVALLTIAG